MIKNIHLTYLGSILIATFLLTSCASHPPLELDPAEKAVASAHRAGAFRTAKEDYKAAQLALEQGQEHAKSGNDLKARENLLKAIEMGHKAELAAYRYQLDATEEQLDSAEEYILRLESQRTIYFEALSSIYDEQKMSEIQVSSVNPSYKPSSNYRVRSGENLFAIAARRKVYGDALLWPLIYKANRDQIKDPQQIYPGQVLTIPRDVTDEEKEEARVTARESKIFQQSPSSNGKK